MCRLSWNLGASTCWTPQGLSRPVMGLLYLYLYLVLNTRYYSQMLTKPEFSEDCRKNTKIADLLLLSTSSPPSLSLPLPEIISFVSKHDNLGGWIIDRSYMFSFLTLCSKTFHLCHASIADTRYRSITHYPSILPPPRRPFPLSSPYRHIACPCQAHSLL
jgi:hypothetical protein